MEIEINRTSCIFSFLLSSLYLIVVVELLEYFNVFRLINFVNCPLVVLDSLSADIERNA
jgi:hypothetical protein